MKNSTSFIAICTIVLLAGGALSMDKALFLAQNDIQAVPLNSLYSPI
jgi:hypothetical protein